MPDLSQAQIQNAEKALNKLLEPLGITARYSDDWDGVEDGIQFYDANENPLFGDEFKGILQEHIQTLKQTKSWDNWNELNAGRLRSIIKHISEGNTGLAGYFVDPHAVIADDALTGELQNLFTDICSETSEQHTLSERAKLVNGTGYEWGGILEIKSGDFTAEQTHKMVQALNWLETYDPDFKETLWHIAQGQHEGKIKHPVGIKYDMGRIYASTNDGTDEVAMGFGPKGYAGVDGKLYHFSLNELFAHELRHIAQKNYPEFAKTEALQDATYVAIRPHYLKLESYLHEKGITNEDQVSLYFEYASYNKDFYRKGLEQRILRDPEFQKLADNYRHHLHAYNDTEHIQEDDAMDHVTGLRALLGKPPRGNYHDTDLFYDETHESLGDAIVYTDPPEAIRKRGHESWELDSIVPMYPLITGEIGPHNGLVSDMQEQWTAQWNSDTRNINEREWKTILDARRQMFAGNIDDITASDKGKLDALTKKLMQEFNKSSGFDQPSQEIKQAFGLSGISLKLN